MINILFLLVLLISCNLVLINSQIYQNEPRIPEEVSVSERQFRVVYEWRTIDFAYRTDFERAQARQAGEFVEQNILISDAKAFANRLYLTMPRMLPGVPATLGWVITPDENGRTDPLVEPFPSWEMNREGDCRALQFVQGIAIDGNGFLWAVDSGRIHTLRPDRPIQTCPPKLLIMDLKKNGTIVHRYEFPEEVVARGTNYLNKIVIDDAFGSFAYITDNSGSDPGIVVFSKRLNRSWKIREPNSMRAALNAVDFAVNGTQLRFSIHIDGIALGPYYNPQTGDTLTINSPKIGLAEQNYERNVYYSPLSSYHLYSIPASILRDPEFPRRSTPRQVFETVTDYGLKHSQTDGMIMDNRGILYFGLLKDHAIASWDSFQPFTPNNQHIIAQDDDYIQWVDGMTFDESGHLFVVINRLHNFVAGRLNPNVVNFRILRAKVGGQSYVITNGPGPGNILPEAGGIYIRPEVDPFYINNNGIGISSTTPFFNHLEGGNPYSYYNGGYRNTFNYFSIFLTIIIATILRL
ncbi:protein yellow-like [Condylostylus longicornis]|uniref:protein yellow-like n=1 Tax=Condylostylus longicornis TaxID=2530218 RepID=UPI00244E1AD8|nr:protein yellow-like [Condylostylus longicornis]